MTVEDEKSFSRRELEQGWRLSCRLYPTEDLEISFGLLEEDSFEILSQKEPDKTEQTEKKEPA